MKRPVIKGFDEAVEYLFQIPRFTGKNTLEDTKAFLQKLGMDFAKREIIHVAGTNGKGSVCAYLRSMLEKAGKKVCVFTSPHLVDVRERFYLCGRLITRDEFMRSFTEILELLNWQELEEGRGYHPSFFEFLFFLAMKEFERANPDVILLETGLGGRLDATNSIPVKSACVITSVSFDHTEYLGDTLEEIAGEKAGIIMPGVPLIYLDQNSEVTKVIQAAADALGVATYPVTKTSARDVKNGHKGIDFSLTTDYYNNSITLHTHALYQVENSLLALRTVTLLHPDISQETLHDGLLECFWAGRMEEVLPEVFVDGAHNADGIRAFLESVENDGFSGRRTLIVSMVKDKDYRTMLQELLQTGLFDRVVFTTIDSYRRLEAAELFEAAEPFCDRAMLESTGSVREALLRFVKAKEPGERIYIAGSLYLVGEVKQIIEEWNL